MRTKVRSKICYKKVRGKIYQKKLDAKIFQKNIIMLGVKWERIKLTWFLKIWGKMYQISLLE